METILRYRIPGLWEAICDKLADKLGDNLGPEARIADDTALQDSGALGGWATNWRTNWATILGPEARTGEGGTIWATNWRTNWATI